MFSSTAIIPVMSVGVVFIIAIIIYLGDMRKNKRGGEQRD